MTSKQAPKLGRRQAFFDSEAIDQLLSMILELATELWVVRERLFTLERAAEQLGLPLGAAIKDYRFTAAESQELSLMRQRMLAELMRNIGRPHRKISRSFAKTSSAQTLRRARRGS